MQDIKTGLYRHFKGNIYEVLYIAKHTESNEDLVVYKSINDGKVYARPINMFNETVDTIQGVEIKRITYLE